MNTTAKLPVSAGDQIHWLADGLTYRVSDSWHSGEISRRGQTITLTREMLSANSDRDGASSFFDLVDDEEGQLKRWGIVFLARGEFPAELSKWIPGTVESQRERERQRVAAHRIADDHERAVALRNIAAEFGPADSGQRSITYPAAANIRQSQPEV
jgi:hypothetical protein